MRLAPLGGIIAALLLASSVLAAGDAFVCPIEPDTGEARAVAQGAPFTRPEASVPPAKRSKLGLYLTALDAYEMIAEDRAAVLFLDVRTRGELQFIGMPTLVDAHVPFMLEAAPPQWDEAAASFRLVQNPDFVIEVDRRLAAKSLTRDSTVILMCQAGLRAARAANVLADAGYTKAYVMIDGFEGDPLAEGPRKGERAVNGWRNAGLPWTTRLDRSRMYRLD